MATRVPDTTLACVDCRYPRLALRAMSLSLEQCEYEAVRFFTDDVGSGPPPDPRIEVVTIPRIASLADYSRFVLKDLVRFIDTGFVQIVQWDGYVTHGASWSDRFLEYDFIGARWWFREPGRDVGNGGFSLRSRKLLAALQDEAIEVGEVEDNTICLVARGLLKERYGIRIAPGELADRYSFEGGVPSGREFGFHGIFNLPYFLDAVELADFLAVVPDEEYASPSFVTLVQRLAGRGRKLEALECARKVRAHPARLAAMPPQFRANLRHAVLGLAARTDPCPCGSGAAFKRCCGALSMWEAA